MGNIIQLLRKSPKQTSAVIAIAAAVVMVPAALFAWGPSRETYTIQKPADHVVFNSITNNPAHGDERNFVQVKEATASNSAYAETADVAAGKEYTIFVYYHNNAATNLNASGKGIAKGTTARVEVPAIVPNGSTDTKSVGYISASNASPQAVWDDISFSNKTGGDVALRYVPGSAIVHSKGAVNGSKLPDSIVTTGATLGYDQLNGDLPGCEQYSGYVTFNVKADQADFTVEKQVRISGTKTWSKNIEAKAGDKIDYLVGYKNTGTTMQNDVVVKDKLPKGVEYQKGSTMLRNALNPDSKNVSDNIVSANGLNISNYTPGSNAYVWFSAQIEHKKELECGTKTYINTATIETNNGSKSDTATVVVKGEECKPEEKKIEVCALDSKKIITIDEKNFDSKKHSKNFEDCKEAPKQIEVCELESKDIITIDEKDFDSKKHSKNYEDCKEAPKVPEVPRTPETPQTPEAPVEKVAEMPAELPETGPADVIAKMAGLVALAASSAYYVTSRRQG